MIDGTHLTRGFDQASRILYVAWIQRNIGDRVGDKIIKRDTDPTGTIRVYLLMGWEHYVNGASPVVVGYADDPHTTQLVAIDMQCQHLEFSIDPFHWDHYRHTGWEIVYQEGVPKLEKAKGGSVRIRREPIPNRKIDEEALRAVCGTDFLRDDVDRKLAEASRKRPDRVPYEETSAKTQLIFHDALWALERTRMAPEVREKFDEDAIEREITTLDELEKAARRRLFGPADPKVPKVEYEHEKGEDQS